MCYNGVKGEKGRDRMIRINRVTVNISDDEYEPAIISMYRTNTKLVEINSDQLGIPTMSEVPEVGKIKYQQYCKDTVIHLLEQGGIEGYYWDPKKPQIGEDGKKIVSKFNSSSFRQEAVNRLTALLDQMNVQYTINQYVYDTVEITEKYKDNNIKFGSTEIYVKVGQAQILVKFELRSGQMCKPKTFSHDGQVYTFNTTNIHKLLKH